MNETKFTRGPWYAAQPEECGGWWIVATDPDGCDCIDSGDGGFEKEDAHLIAAAPELYEALQGLLADITEYQEINDLGGQNNHWQIIARAALAKARGEA